MVIVSILPHAEYGPNGHREDAPYIDSFYYWIYLLKLQKSKMSANCLKISAGNLVV